MHSAHDAGPRFRCRTYMGRARGSHTVGKDKVAKAITCCVGCPRDWGFEHFVPRTDLAMERRVRLRRTGDVRRVYDEGRSWAHPLLVLVARPNGLDLCRVGVTASRRVGSAVARNRAKRLLREAACHLYPQFGSGWDVMLIARASVLKVKEPQVEKALASLLRRAGLST